MLDDFPVAIERSVSWGQMDAFQHVNNVEYFRFFEDARIAYFEEMGIYNPEADQGGAGIGPILAETSCKFIAPLTYPDDILVGARTSDLADDRFTLEYAIASDRADRTVAVGDSVVVPFDFAAGQKADLPDEWREAIVAMRQDRQENQ